MIGLVLVQNHWVLAGDLIAARGLDRAQLLPLLAPLPARALNARNWVPYEALFGRERVRDMVNKVSDCGVAPDADGEDSWWDHHWCRLGVGLLPEQSRQDSDALWLQRLAAVPPEGPADCNALLAAPWRHESSRWPAWRNTLGRRMLSEDWHWESYVARQADLELLRQTLLALIRRHALPPGADVEISDGGGQLAGCAARLRPDDTRKIRLPAI
jgi:hypothetical protein